MSAGGPDTRGLDDSFQRERYYRRDGTVILRYQGGTEAKFYVSPRDGTIVVRCDGGTVRYFYCVTGGRDNNGSIPHHKEVYR